MAADWHQLCRSALYSAVLMDADPISQKTPVSKQVSCHIFLRRRSYRNATTVLGGVRYCPKGKRFPAASERLHVGLFSRRFITVRRVFYCCAWRAMCRPTFYAYCEASGISVPQHMAIWQYCTPERCDMEEEDSPSLLRPKTLPPTMYDPSLTLTQFCALLKTMLFYRAYETLPRRL